MKVKLTKTLLVTSAAAAWLFTHQVSVADDDDDAGGAEIRRESDEGDHGRSAEGSRGVRLSPDHLDRLGLRVETVGPGLVDDGVELFGEVRPNGDRLAEMAPRFPGVVQQVFKAAGDLVRGGDVLATIESNESLAPYPLRTLIDGTIISKHITRGESVARDDPAFVVADLSTVWVDLAVFQKDIGRVGIGTRVRVSGEGGASSEGMVSYLTPVVDRATRTVTARVVLENQRGLWRPGMFVTAKVISGESAPLTVLRSALQTVGGADVVFTESDEGFRPAPVQIGRRGREVVEVLSGVPAGARYVSGNTSLLKAELGKEEAEDDD